MTDQHSFSKPTILFRADGSDQMGFGHLVRCSTLATQLSADGARVLLVTHSMDHCPQWVIDLFPGEIHELREHESSIPDEGDPVSHADWLVTTQNEDAEQTLELMARLQLKQADCLVVDHYGIDARWHRQMRPFCRKLLAIDDLADRDLDVDVLLDQNRSLQQATVDYGNHLPSEAVVLAGPHWSLIRSEFRNRRECPRSLNEQSPRLLVIMGGSDPGELTSAVVESLIGVETRLDITAVIGQSDQLQRLEKLRSSMVHDLRIRVAETQMASLMADADLAISAAGSAVWELCCMGVPMALLVGEVNQHAVIKQVEAAGAAVRLPAVGPDVIEAILGTILNGRGRLEVMSRAGQELVDGEGARRASEVILHS